MAPIPVVQARTLEHLSEFLKGTHLRFDDLCSQFGLSDMRLDCDGCFVPLREALMIEEEVSRATGDELLGLHLAELSGLRALGRHGLYITSAPTLGEAIERANGHLSDHMLGARLMLIPSGPHMLWCYELSTGILVGRQHSNLFSLALMRDVVRLAAGKSWRPYQVRFEGQAMAGTGDLHRAFGASMVWGSAMTALAFRKELLELPLARHNPPIGEAWASEEGRLEKPQPAYVESLKRLVKSLLQGGHLNLPALARWSGLSERSLQRQLHSLGLSFSALVDRARLELALELMRDPDQSLIDIGLELGYSDAANFTRAFKRWTGVAPRNYRHDMGGDRLNAYLTERMAMGSWPEAYRSATPTPF
jgi:AraC-like DNA-binding protein